MGELVIGGDALNISISTDIRIRFTPEERAALELSRDTLKKISDKLWQSDNDDAIDVGCLFGDTAHYIEDILNENY